MSMLLKDEAYNKLIRKINNGELVYEKTYSLNVLAAEMEMSRTPIREAVQKLCDEKRLDMMPSVGFRLHYITPEEILHHYHFSNAIEGYCVRCLAQKYQTDKRNKYVRRMKHLLLDMEEALSEDVPFGDYFELDQQFHAEILDSLEDSYFSELKSSPMGFYSHPELQLTGKELSRKAVYDCHKKILDAICAGDSTGAYDAMEEHAKMMLKAC
ncbi:MAG: GntR family transcriptional regulator [Clostridia bacterium]|nr:GntR family transcriptional regulator [Lachnospiraceae bacterium]NCC02056.1 GntR family transcriptional regulator [Clostridia bacterium]NCD03921.1 GntR family transcriptional regulator [Clostridia bacterium]